MSTLTVTYKGVTVSTTESGLSQRTTDYRIKEIVRAIDEEVKDNSTGEGSGKPSSLAKGGVFTWGPRPEIKMPPLVDLRKTIDDFFNRRGTFAGIESVAEKPKTEEKKLPDFKIGDLVTIKDHSLGPLCSVYRIVVLENNFAEVSDNFSNIPVKRLSIANLIHYLPPKPKKQFKPVTDLTRFVATYKQAGLAVEVRHCATYDAIMHGEIMLSTFDLNGSLNIPR